MMMMFYLPLLVALFSSLAAVQSSISRGRAVLGSKREHRKLEIINNSGKKLVVDWVNPVTGETVTLHEGVVDGQAQIFNSFVNHTFSIHESTESCGAVDGRGNCVVRFITVNDQEEQGTVSTLLYC
jgi:hypothetical protein